MLRTAFGNLSLILTLLFSWWPPLSAPLPVRAMTATILRVNAAVAASGNGTSWAAAFKTLPEALAVTNANAAQSYEIWVAQGIYKNTDPALSFRIERNNVQLYGGFAGTETQRTQRNWATHPTVLSGDVDNNDTTVDGVVLTTADIVGTNAYHVLYLDGVTNGPLTSTVVLDGFTITAGQSTDKDGGGLYCDGNGSGHECSPTLTNLIFSGNQAGAKGGGLYNNGTNSGASNPTLTHVIFRGNLAYNVGGGGIYNDGYSGMSSPTLINVTLAGNIAAQGGGLYNEGGNGTSTPTLINCILWGNWAFTDDQIYNASANPTVTYSDIQGSYSGTGNIADDPLFVNMDQGNLRLAPGSPAIDAGNTPGVTAATDLDGRPRVQDTAVDMGAYENSYRRLTLQWVGNGLGNIAITPDGPTCTTSCQVSFTSGTVVTLSATALFSTTFQGWSGAVTGITNPLTLTMTSDYTLTATFTSPSYLITPTAGVGGRILPATPQTALGGTDIAFTIIPTMTYRIVDVYVDGAPVGVVGTYTFTRVSANHTISAAFAHNLRYVDKDAPGPTHDGLSWTTAYTTVQNILDLARADLYSTYEVWVAEGRYYPDEGGSHINDAVTETFRIERNNIQLYGGFAATETLRTQRNWIAHPTILSGDIDQNDTTVNGVVTDVTGIAGNNAGHVLYLDGVTHEPLIDTLVLDGFIITAGHAYGKTSPNNGGGGLYCDGNSGHECSPTLRNLTFSGNQAAASGGGIYNNGFAGKSGLTLINVIFSGNQANSGVGGGMATDGADGTNTATLINVVFSRNSAPAGVGGGMAIFDSDLGSGSTSTLINVTMAGNQAVYGGGIYHNNLSDLSSLNLVNCILWGNTASNFPSIYSNGGTPSITYSDIQGGYEGTGNLDIDPLFVDAAQDNLRLNPASPAINAGNTAIVTVDTDLDGRPRVQNDRVDLGAYESSSNVLTLHWAGNGLANIAISPNGPTCTTACQTRFAPGTLVTLTATPLVSTTFQGWSGAVTGLTNPVTLTLNSDQEITATFTSPTHLITPTAGANGSLLPGTPQTITRGSDITFTVIPAPNYRIADVYVDGASVGAVASYHFTYVTADHTISATFDHELLYVDKEAAGPTHDGRSWATAFTTVQDALDLANAHPDTFYEVWVAEGLYYPDEGGSHVADARMESFRIERNNVQLYGGFAATETQRTQRNWTTHPTILSGDIDQNDAAEGGVVTDATGIVGNNASHVLYLDGVTYGPITNTVVLDGFTITAGLSNNALGELPGGGGLYCGGSGHECSPILSNLIFSGNHANTKGGALYNNGTNEGISSPTLTNVIFRGNQAYSSGLGGSGGGMCNDSDYNGISSPTLINVTFSNNRAGSSGEMLNAGFADGISSPQRINVVFSRKLAPSGVGGGIANLGLYGGVSAPTLVNCILWGNTATNYSQIYNESVSATVRYSDIQGGYSGTGNLDLDPQFVDAARGNFRLLPTSPVIDAGDTTSVTVATDLDGRARVQDAAVDMGAYESSYPRLALAFTGNGAGIISSLPARPACSAGCVTYFYSDTVVTLTAAPLISSSFKGWSGDVTGMTNPLTLTMNSDRAVTAAFALNTYAITPTAGANGSITPGSVQTVNYDSDATFAINPAQGYHIADVWVDGASIGVVNAYTFTNVTANHTITAAFAVNTYVITPTAGANGTISPNSPQTVNHGSSITFTMVPTPSHHVADVRVDGVSVGSPSVYAFTNITANHTITVAFALNTYTITPTAGANGSISPNSPQTVPYGGSAAFTISPTLGYHIADVRVDGSSVGAVNAYTFTNVIADHTITAAFAINCQAILTSAFTFTPLTPIVGEAVGFTGTVSAGSGPLTYTWNWGDGSATGSGITISHTFPLTAIFRTYTVTMSVSNSCSGPLTVSQSIQVRPRQVFLPCIMKNQRP